MKVLVCGSREWVDFQTIAERMAELPPGTLVIQGRAKGADKMARFRAIRLGHFVVDVPVEDVHWQRYGKSAGHKRNHAMLDLGPDLVIAFQRGGSSGTQGTIDEARRRGIPVEVHAQ
ncbi:MAG: DUF2493 domain-containing protein [Solirubrobacteraceae bacterium]